MPRIVPGKQAHSPRARDLARQLSRDKIPLLISSWFLNGTFQGTNCADSREGEGSQGMGLEKGSFLISSVSGLVPDH